MKILKKRWSQFRTVGTQEPGSVRVRNNRNFRGETHSRQRKRTGCDGRRMDCVVTTLSILVISSVFFFSFHFFQGFYGVVLCVFPFQLLSCMVGFAIHKTAVQKWQVLRTITGIAEYILTAEQRHRLFPNQLMELARKKWRSTTEEIIRTVMILEDSTREFGGVNSVGFPGDHPFPRYLVKASICSYFRDVYLIVIPGEFWTP